MAAKHRIIEPFLVILMDLGMIPFRNNDNRIVWHINLNENNDYPWLVKTLAAKFINHEEQAIDQEEIKPVNCTETFDDFDF